MDKQRLTTLINQPGKIEETDFIDLKNLKNEYPYFQALLPLITIASKKYSLQSEKQYLRSAAIYALDRKHLKEILTQDYESLSSDDTIKEKPQKKKNNTEEINKVVAGPIHATKKQDQEVERNSSSKIDVSPSPLSSHLPDSFFDELFKDMEALKEQKEYYQKTLARFESRNSQETKAKIKPKAGSKKTAATITPPAKKTTAKPKATTAKKGSTTKKTRTVKPTTKNTSAAKAQLGAKKTSTAKTKKASKSTEKKPKKDEYDIIEEITSRKELKINDAHKKEQINIINNFIEKEPVLTKRIDLDNQTNKQQAEDLSASSTNLSDDVVSETLAKLMIKQGRKQKAIDIYKKLIWKFPQKKTYFVEIISELKKES